MKLSHRLNALLSLLVAGVLCVEAGAGVRKPLFKRTHSVAAPDTLDVFVLCVEFGGPVPEAAGINDESSTTGFGRFGTDKDTVLTLDPNGEAIRSHRFYLDKHFEFAGNYFNKVSDGGVVIRHRIFPRPDAEGQIKPVKLSRRMKAYNPTRQDNAKQKIKDFQTKQAMALMTFVSESAHLFDNADSLNNPFLIANRESKQNPSPLRHPVFMIFHAGHSRLIDGGSLGPLGANSPNDFTDFFVTKGDFTYLDSATNSFEPKGTPAIQQRKDARGVVPTTVPGDTITEFMMLSESASQDKTNWGINGILVNQLARQMGMPDLFDVVKGISQVGYFDMMDFAGYNTLSGFLPVFPSAWTRAFMGWDTPVEAKRGTAFTEFNIHAADIPGPGRIRTVKIPLNEREYLLVENRQRSATDSITVYFSKNQGLNGFKFDVPDSVKVPVSFADSLFQDSTCATYKDKTCTKKKINEKKPKGVITGASNYDLGLPGSGLLVWHVNEWFLDAFLQAGAVNAYLGDTLRNQYKGLELVEADGIPSIGKEFTDFLGQPAFDYGTAQDFLPHLFRKRKDPPRDTNWASIDTLLKIGTYGFANTNAWNDGRSHITLEAKPASNTKLSPTVGDFTGDSVFNFRDTALTLRVVWPNDSSISQPSGSFWPIRMAPSVNPQAVNVLRDGVKGGPYVVSLSDSGALQTFSAGGKSLLIARDSTRDSSFYAGVRSVLASGNSRANNVAPINSLADPDGSPLGACVLQDSIFALLTSKSLRLIRPLADSLQGNSRNGGVVVSIPLQGNLGPIAINSTIFVLDNQQVLRGFSHNGTQTDSISLPKRLYHALAGLVLEGASHLIATGQGGFALRINLSSRQISDLKPAWGNTSISAQEIFSASVSDFDRDGSDDVFLLGSQGNALLLHTRLDKQGQAFQGFPQAFKRSIVWTDTSKKFLVTEDKSSPALADLNRDGHPDLVFSGTNAVFAINWRGAPLPGWPFLPQPKQDIGFTYANRNLLPTIIGSTPLVLSLRGKPTVLLGSPDGLVYAVDSLGKPLKYSSFTSNRYSGVLMNDKADWPLTAGGLSLDTLRVPTLHLTLAQLDSGDLELMAQSATGSLNVWTLRQTSAKSGQNWLMPGGNPERTFRLDAKTLGQPITPVELEAIEEFHLFPSPLRGGIATVHLKVGTSATKARIRLFDLAGNPVADQSINGLTPGLQPLSHRLDLRRLAPDVYAVLCEVWFPGGKKSNWQRIGIIK